MTTFPDNLPEARGLCSPSPHPERDMAQSKQWHQYRAVWLLLLWGVTLFPVKAADVASFPPPPPGCPLHMGCLTWTPRLGAPCAYSLSAGHAKPKAACFVCSFPDVSSRSQCIYKGPFLGDSGLLSGICGCFLWGRGGACVWAAVTTFSAPCGL